MRGRPKAELVLSEAEREQLTALTMRRKTAQALARCEEIVNMLLLPGHLYVHLVGELPGSGLVAPCQTYFQHGGGGCAEFCVNGQSIAGESLLVCKHNDNQETRSTARTVSEPVGR